MPILLILLLGPEGGIGTPLGRELRIKGPYFLSSCFFNSPLLSMSKFFFEFMR
ncbi:hypothetical protein LguiB_003442 [Lonicera macranthoides]